MNCRACAGALEVEGIEPDCHTERGCIIPPPGEDGARILEIRGLLLRLRGVIDPGTICRICDVDRDDLELLALVEDELKPEPPKED